MPSNTLRLPNLSAVHFCSTAFCPFPATATRGPQSPHRSTEWSKWPASERARQPSPFPSPLFPLVFDDPLRRPSFTERNLRPCRSPFHVTCSEAPASTTVAIHPPPPTATGSGAASNSFQPFQGCLGRNGRRYLESGRVGHPNQRSPPGGAAPRSNSCWWSGPVSPLVLMVPERARERSGVAPKTWERANRDWKSYRALAKGRETMRGRPHSSPHSYLDTILITQQIANRLKSRCIRAWLNLGPVSL